MKAALVLEIGAIGIITACEALRKVCVICLMSHMCTIVCKCVLMQFFPLLVEK